MTSNHLLLYHIAECMLEQQHHIIPVDDLFDDDFIADFVKSIQIDSPYQQMLFEGVLTESIRDEKLFVSFTVEGYFHYVLGEVIYNRTEGLGAEALKVIVEGNKMNGAQEGVVQCLIREVSNCQYNRLFQLIDLGGEISKCCSVPFAYGILITFNNKHLNRGLDNKYSLDFLLNWLISDSTESDYDVLYMAIMHLEKTQKNECLYELFNSIIKLKQYSNISYVKAIIKGLPFLEQDLKYRLLEEIEQYLDIHKEHLDYPEIIFELATKQLMCAEYDKAISLFKKSILIYENRNGSYVQQLEKLYSNLGSAYWYKGDLSMTQYYFEMSYSICEKVFGMHSQSTSGSLQNLALVHVMKEEYEESINLFNKAIKISSKVEGLNHPITARILSNLGSANLRLKKFDNAYDFFKKAIFIDKAVLHSIHPNIALDYEDIGDVFFEKGEFVESCKNYELSKKIFINNFGLNYHHVKILQEKIDSIKNL